MLAYCRQLATKTLPLRTFSPANFTNFNCRISTLNTHAKSILISLTQFFGLALLAALPTAIVMLDVMWLGNNIGEESLTEAAQSLTLVLVIATFVYIVAKHEDKRPFTYMALGLFISMLFREHDFMLNKMIDNLWEACVALTVITVVILARRTGKPFAPVFAAYLKSPAARIMAVALVLLVVHSRLFGMGVLWRTVLDDGYVRTVKNAMEEGTELLAYLMIFYAAQVYRRELADKS